MPKNLSESRIKRKPSTSPLVRRPKSRTPTLADVSSAPPTYSVKPPIACADLYPALCQTNGSAEETFGRSM